MAEDEGIITEILAGTHALIDLDAYTANIQALRAAAPHAELMAVVKADAYGHGAVYCGHAAVAAGCAWLGVARISEGLLLRSNGISAPVLVLGPPNLAEITRALDANLTLAVGSRSVLDAVLGVAAGRSSPARVHIKVDTGMHRYGFEPHEVCDLFARLQSHAGIAVDGVFTHFARADERDLSLTDRQVAVFSDVVASLEAAGLLPRWVHQANSAGILIGRTVGSNLVRSGIATYGLDPSDELPAGPYFTPIMTVRAPVGRRFTLPRGEGVAYGWTYVAPETEEDAVVAIGYADGLPRQLANRGWFSANGERAPIHGRVCMDQTIIGAPPGLAEGDLVTVFGPEREAMSLNDIAAIAGTNSYEIATRLMARVPRIYLQCGTPVAWEQPLLGKRGYCRS